MFDGKDHMLKIELSFGMITMVIFIVIFTLWRGY